MIESEESISFGPSLVEPLKFAETGFLDSGMRHFEDVSKRDFISIFAATYLGQVFCCGQMPAR